MPTTSELEPDYKIEKGIEAPPKRILSASTKMYATMSSMEIGDSITIYGIAQHRRFRSIAQTGVGRTQKWVWTSKKTGRSSWRVWRVE